MITFQDTYDNRKKEIEEFLELINFLAEKNQKNGNDESEFCEFFYSGKNSISLTYQSLTNILKSNMSLMIYNIIEYTVTNLINCIYDEIKMNQLSYIDVNVFIREQWRKSMLKGVRDPNASLNTLLNKNEKMIEAIVDKICLDMSARDVLPEGNLDGVTICKVFDAHGMKIKTNSENYRPDILEGIKNNRNNLAHGSISFVDAMKSTTLSDIQENKEIVFSFLDELIDIVSSYIQNKEYIQDSIKTTFD